MSVILFGRKSPEPKIVYAIIDNVGYTEVDKAYITDNPDWFQWVGTVNIGHEIIHSYSAIC